MATELVLSNHTTEDPDRPVFIKSDNWTISIATMDEHYRRQIRGFKRLIMDSHPDRGGTHEKFLATQGKFRRWLNEERVRYARLGLRPPRLRRGRI